MPLDIFFQRKGRPIIFCYNNNSSYEAAFTLATLTEDYSTTQNTTLLSSNPNTSIIRSSNENIENKNPQIAIRDKSNKFEFHICLTLIIEIIFLI